jgi:hypothetical protein
MPREWILNDDGIFCSIYSLSHTLLFILKYNSICSPRIYTIEACLEKIVRFSLKIQCVNVAQSFMFRALLHSSIFTYLSLIMHYSTASNLFAHSSILHCWFTYAFSSSALLHYFNPKPHGSGWICPHSFQRPITQKVLKLKKLAKNTYSTENFCWI